MNILIYGKMASGKTFVAIAIKQHYERQGQHCDLLEDDGSPNPLGATFLAGPKAMARFLNKTIHNTDRHFIFTTQVIPMEILRLDTEGSPALFDYVYCLERPRR